MPNNNPSGVNSWQGFGTEEPYGQATQDNALAAAAPLASGNLAAGAINAPKQAQRGAQEQPQLLPVNPPHVTPMTSVWQQIANTPGASPLALSMAEKALR